MATKLLYSLSEDNPDVHKKIGCMTGIFQIFDRHQMTGRRITDQSHMRKNLHRHSQFSKGSLEEEFIGAYQHPPAEMNSRRSGTERQRLSTESSIASFSSSHSSSFSSVDYCRSNQPDPAYSDRITFPEAAFDDSSHSSISPKLARRSADFRDIKKDVMFKEARGVLVKTTNREDSMSCAAKQRGILIDSKPSKTVDAVSTHRNQNTGDNINGSIKALSKQQGPSWLRNESKEQGKQLGCSHRSKEASSVSYEGLGTHRLSFDSRETISASKLRDLPRLSLDSTSRECLMRQGDCTSLSNSQLKASLNRSCSINEKGQTVRQVSETQQGGSPSLVAKLMGLTALPDATSANTKDKGLTEVGSAQDEVHAFRSLAKPSLRKPVLDSIAQCSKKEPVSPSRVTSEVKPFSSSRIAEEPAPWKKQSTRSPTRQPNHYSSVYNEIEKRFNDIEFDQSGKDLRALKYILESIHAKGILENEKQEQASNVANSINKNSISIETNQECVSAAQCHVRPLDLPIVIMKPICRLPRSKNNMNVHKDYAVSSNEKFKSSFHSTRPQQQPKSNTASSPRTPGSVSPRTHLKKLDLEKQVQAQRQPTDANISRGNVSKLVTESGSPGGKTRLKCNKLQQNGRQIREILLDIKRLRSQGNEASSQSDGNPTLYLKKAREVTGVSRLSQLNGSHSPSKRASNHAVLISNHLSDRQSLPVKPEEVYSEDHSPVSVLSTPAYMDDLTTIGKYIKMPPGDFAENYSAYEKESSGDELGLTSAISGKKLLSIESLVQKLKRLNSTHDESKKDYIALLNDDTNLDHRYISEILIASGLLLREFGCNAQKPLQLHPSGYCYLINPELFNVLEQTKLRDNGTCSDESKWHRKLIFDTVNEILTKKLSSHNSTMKHWKVARKAGSGHNLVKEICAEVDEMQARKKLEDGNESEGVMNVSWGWSVMELEGGGISEVVLDIERLIFKELVNEVVMGDYRTRQKPGSGCRRELFG